MTFVDLTKDFDTVTQEDLWKIMAKFGCPDKFITMFRQLTDRMTTWILYDCDCSDTFPVSNKVKQGCILAPTLFSMMFSAMLTDAFRDCDQGVCIKYRTDRELFSLHRLYAFGKVKETMFRSLFFANNCALNTESELKMQDSMDKFSTACDNFGLTISTKKTKVMHQATPGQPYVKPSITAKGQELSAVNKLKYLSSILSKAVHTDDKVNCRIAKASLNLEIYVCDIVWE